MSLASCAPAKIEPVINDGKSESFVTKTPVPTPAPGEEPQNTDDTLATEDPAHDTAGLVTFTEDDTPMPSPSEETAAPETISPETPDGSPSATDVPGPTETPPAETPAGELVTFLTLGSSKQGTPVSSVSEEFKNHYNDFALKLMDLCSGEGGSLVSPLSVMTALLMTANGAKGETLEEMLNVLFGSMSLEEANTEILSYYSGLVNSEDASLEDANAVFFTDREDFSVSNDFLEAVESLFKAAVAKASFTDPETVDIINNWCDENTDGMIKKVLNYDDVGVDTIMVLLNALCFNAIWQEQYQDHQVRKGVFHGENGDSDVELMYSTESGYIKGEREEGFVKYYKGGKYAFVALLPEKGMDMSDYIKSLENGRLNSLIASGKGNCSAAIPEFKFDLSKELSDVLQVMGIVSAFSDFADLSGLGTLDSGDNLAVSKVIHKTHIEVDPSGTRAAAVTAVIVDRVTSIEPDEKPEVILDRPFLYAIVDTTSMLPVFIGTLTDIGA